MDPIQIINKYYRPESRAYNFLVQHSRMVAEKASLIAGRLKQPAPDMEFIREASMLHDIGIVLTDEPRIGCFGTKPYICHGYLGREILEKEGLPRHALVCERHIGTGLSLADIEEHDLPVPKRDMRPVSVEEQIICFADKFFSKSPEFLRTEKPLERVRKDIAKFGGMHLRQFEYWLNIFCGAEDETRG